MRLLELTCVVYRPLKENQCRLYVSDNVLPAVYAHWVTCLLKEYGAMSLVPANRREGSFCYSASQPLSAIVQSYEALIASFNPPPRNRTPVCNQVNKSVVFFGWRCARFRTPMSAIIFTTGRGEIITERHDRDIGTMCYEIHPQSGRTPLVDTLRWTAVACHAAAGVCSGKNLRTHIHR